MIKIEILASCSGVDFSYYPGEVVDVSPERAADLIKHQLARPAQTANVVPGGQTATATPAGQTANVRPTGQTRRR